MSVVNLREKIIHAKIVYYGPPLGGKTTSLQHVHRVLDPERTTELVSLDTEKDRTLFFDFLPIGLGRIGDFTIRMQGFTVPGQVKYLLTRRFVLRGADAVVFVADSRESQREANLVALRDLRENLAVNGLDYASVPLVLEYNKRDAAPVLALGDLDRDLNDRGVPRFETVATEGTGVFEAFTAAAASMVERICAEYRIAAGTDVGGTIRSALARFPAAAGPGRRSVIVVKGEDASAEGGGEAALLERAIQGSMQAAELLAEVQHARAELESRVTEMEALYRVGGAAAASLDQDRVVASVVEGAAAALGLSHASILLADPADGSLRERGVHGFLYDPLVAGSAGAARCSALAALLGSREPVLVSERGPEGVLEAVRAREPSVHAAVVAPLRIRDEPRGLLVVYYTGTGPGPGDAAVRFLGALAAAASVALENARLHGDLDRSRRDLESKVAERTRDLEAALAELRQLDRLKEDFLSNMSHELMTPLAGVRSSAEILRTYPDMSAPEREEFVRGIEREALRLTDRLQDILDLSALDAGGVRLARVAMHPREIVQAALERARPQFEARGVRANVWPQAGIPRVQADPRWLGRAVEHLLSNAAKFSPEKGEVDVTVERDGDVVRIAVRDRGPGIPPAERESLFRRFKQTGQVLTDKVPGLGAGLPLARRIVEAHGGTLELGGGPGRGTVATVRLPIG